MPREGFSGKVTSDTLEQVKEGADQKGKHPRLSKEQTPIERRGRENLAPGPFGTEF